MSDYVNHLVICGYDHSTHLLLDAINKEMDLKQTRVVLFDQHERPSDLPTEFFWVEGDPTKESELDKVRLTHARARAWLGPGPGEGCDGILTLAWGMVVIGTRPSGAALDDLNAYEIAMVRCNHERKLRFQDLE